MNNTELFYDPQISGHHVEYIGHVINFIYDKNLSKKYIFLVHPAFSTNYPTLFEKVSLNENTKIVEITPKEISFISSGNILYRSIKNILLLNKYVNKFQANKVFLFYLNTFQFALAFYPFNYEIKGILFKQFYRMQRNGLKEKLVYYRKYFQTLLFIKRNKITAVFILNDEKTVKDLNNKLRTHKFNVLYDPVPNLQANPNISLRKMYNIEIKRKLILHIGALSKRKGTLDILDSFKYLEKDELHNFTILLIGKADMEFDKLIQKKF